MARNMVSYPISNAEIDLLDDIEEIGFGELYEVSIQAERPCVVMDMNPSCANFIRDLREYKIFNKLVVHDGLPASAEIVTETSRGRPYIRKLRF